MVLYGYIDVILVKKHYIYINDDEICISVSTNRVFGTAQKESAVVSLQIKTAGQPADLSWWWCGATDEKWGQCWYQHVSMYIHYFNESMHVAY